MPASGHSVTDVGVRLLSHRTLERHFPTLVTATHVLSILLVRLRPVN